MASEGVAGPCAVDGVTERERRGRMMRKRVWREFMAPEVREKSMRRSWRSTRVSQFVSGLVELSRVTAVWATGPDQLNLT